MPKNNKDIRKRREQADIFKPSDSHFSSVQEWFAAIDHYPTADAFRGNWHKQRKLSSQERCIVARALYFSYLTT